MAVASVRLSSGQTVTVPIDTPVDGNIDPGEVNQALQSIQNEIQTRYPGSFIDWNARIRISEERPDGTLATRDIAAGGLARNPGVVLFGNNPMTTGNGEVANNPALWAPVAWEEWGGRHHTIYHEADRWNPALNDGQGGTVWGRTIRVQDDGLRFVYNQETNGWDPIDSSTPGGRIPSLPYRSREYLESSGLILTQHPDASYKFLATAPVSTPVTWAAEPQVREGFAYFQGSNGEMLRRGATAATRDRPAEVSVRDAAGRVIHWRLADDRDGTIPPPPAVRTVPPDPEIRQQTRVEGRDLDYVRTVPGSEDGQYYQEFSSADGHQYRRLVTWTADQPRATVATPETWRRLRTGGDPDRAGDWQIVGGATPLPAGRGRSGNPYRARRI